jgi:uncharacterized protein
VLHAAGGGLHSYFLYQYLVDVLPANGYAVFLYDRRGNSESDGDFNTAKFISARNFFDWRVRML